MNANQEMQVDQTVFYNRAEHMDLPSAANQGAAHQRVSPRFTFVHTGELVRRIEPMGWRVVRSKQATVRLPERMGYQKHAVWLRLSGVMSEMRQGFVPELLIVNAHDGTSSYQLHAGIYRVVCLNGMVCADSTFSAVRFPHRGSSTDRVIDASQRLIDAIPQLVDRVNLMKSIDIDQPRRLDFAEEALALRYPENPPVDPPGLLCVRRSDDAGTDLWSTLNVIQENLLRGGSCTSTGRLTDRRHIRYVRSCRGSDTTVGLNRRLW